jgi:Family of unknown function (DUF5414)
MINEEKMEVLNQQFQRIFTLPVTRLTFRELQSAIATALNEDNEAARHLIEGLLSNQPNHSSMEPFFKNYSVPFRVAKQIQDNGEVLSMLTTDVGSQGENLAFQVRMRRIDGGEFTFITDASSFLQIAEHIISRLASTASTPAGKGTISHLQPRLEALGKAIKQIS